MYQYSLLQVYWIDRNNYAIKWGKHVKYAIRVRVRLDTVKIVITDGI